MHLQLVTTSMLSEMQSLDPPRPTRSAPAPPHPYTWAPCVPVETDIHGGNCTGLILVWRLRTFLGWKLLEACGTDAKTGRPFPTWAEQTNSSDSGEPHGQATPQSKRRYAHACGLAPTCPSLLVDQAIGRTPAVNLKRSVWEDSCIPLRLGRG